MTCENPIGFETLVAYWLGEVPEDREAMLEEHLFGCDHCSPRLAALVALASGVRTAVNTGKVALVASAPFVDAMKQTGLRLREYRLGPGDSVNCTIRTDDDAVIAHMRAPLAGVERLDLVSTVGDGPEMRLADVPFDVQSGEVLMIPSAAWLRTMSSFTMRTRLVAVSAAGETQLGAYTFNHSPS
jgi:anti-sigma factor RsiW